jgi:hypothetical protein
MTREELLALGLSEEQAQNIAAELETAAQLAAENARLQEQISALQTQIDLHDKRDAVAAQLPLFKPRDVQLVLRLIDLDKITIEEGKVSGLDEQIQALQSTAPYLFLEMPDPVGGTAASGLHHEHFDMNTFLRGEN